MSPNGKRGCRFGRPAKNVNIEIGLPFHANLNDILHWLYHRYQLLYASTTSSPIIDMYMLIDFTIILPPPCIEPWMYHGCTITCQFAFYLKVNEPPCQPLFGSVRIPEMEMDICIMAPLLGCYCAMYRQLLNTTSIEMKILIEKHGDLFGCAAPGWKHSQRI